jgi:acetyltransferase-like isoleucine patch superfamily enzyme
MTHAAAAAAIDPSATIEAGQLVIDDGARVHANVRIRGHRVRLGRGCTIGRDVVIEADEIELGPGSAIDERTVIGAGGRMQRFELGDHVYVGNDVKILVPEFRLMDYSKLHNHILVNGSKPVRIGYNCWIGQNVILNASDSLTIGNNFGFGSFSAIQTHASHGELLEGCRIYKVAPITIEDDAWSTGGGDVIGPGVRVGRRAVIVSPALVTRDIPDFGVVGGVPARDLSHKIVPYVDVTLEWKMAKMQELLRDFVRDTGREWVDDGDGTFAIRSDGRRAARVQFVEHVTSVEATDVPTFVFAKHVELATPVAGVSAFDLTTKRYTKSGTAFEIELMKHMVSFRARFVPYERTQEPAWTA